MRRRWVIATGLAGALLLGALAVQLANIMELMEMER